MQEVRCGHADHVDMGDCPTPEDLSDVVITTPVEIRFPLSLDTAMALIDLDSDALAYLRDQWIDLSGEETSDQELILTKLYEGEKKRIVREMRAEGLTLAQIARYLGESEEAVVSAFYGANHKRRDITAAVIACDQALHQGSDLGQRALCREYGLTQDNVRALQAVNDSAGMVSA